MKYLPLYIFTYGFLFASDSIGKFAINGMMCSTNCPKLVYQSLENIEGIKSCKVDYESKLVTIVFDSEQINSDEIIKTISRNTYFKISYLDKKNYFYSIWNWFFD